MTTISDLMTAFQNAVNAQHEYNKAYEEYDGYSWDWAGGDYIDATKKAQIAFESALEQYIDERIAVVIAKAKGE